MISEFGQRGRALLGLLVGLAGAGLVLASAAGLGPSAARGNAVSAARSLAGQLRNLGLEARGDGHSRGIVFPLEAAEPYRSARDGDGDGLSRGDLARGEDQTLAWSSLACDTPGVGIASPPWRAPAIPPSRGEIGPQTPAIRFGPSRMCVLTGDGRARPGSLFITDGRQALCAVVIAGPTARVRVLCFDRHAGRWRER